MKVILEVKTDDAIHVLSITSQSEYEYHIFNEDRSFRTLNCKTKDLAALYAALFVQVYEDELSSIEDESFISSNAVLSAGLHGIHSYARSRRLYIEP